MRDDADSLNGSRVLALTVPRDISTSARRQRVLDAMAVAVAEKTFAAVTIADLVGRARISRASFYKLFPDKRSCFAAAVDSFAGEVCEAATAAYSDDDPPAEAIRAAVAAILDLLAAKPAYAKLALLEAVSVEPALVDRHRRPIIDALTALWARERLPRRAEAWVALGRAQVLIADWIAAGRVEQLPELLPDLVYSTLLPIAGQEEALAQARLAGANGLAPERPRRG